jgi:Histidine kinase-, DNA gyrase B-, and HSP90-like ATPase
LSERNVFFRVSSGLKNILGKDLITNDFVAVFELVKNSFDAHAANVWLVYRNDKLFVVDDGKGMSEDDILNKWLFVAYSAKEDGTEDQDISQDYRDELASKRYFAGNKGVGRFSCDRLGSQLKLQSKTNSEEAIHLLKVEWDDFEKSLSEEFIDIPAKLDDLDDYDLPMEIRELRQGTILEISNLRESWDRQKLITLRRHLEKLINPFELTTSSFRVHVICDREQAEDNKIKPSTDADADNLELEEYAAPVTVNGEVRNLIFAELSSKTTHIKVNFDKSNSDLVTTLIDRSEEVYVTRESHNFSTLVDTDFSCSLFYLNRAAKTIFAKRMGISSVNFGSIFLFKNNFRIFPTGETGDDTFGIDRRKSQGYARYLGTRDLVGRIDIRGNGKEFKEST